MCVYVCVRVCVYVLSSPGGLFFWNTFEGGGDLIGRGDLFNLEKCINGSTVFSRTDLCYRALYCFF